MFFYNAELKAGNYESENRASRDIDISDIRMLLYYILGTLLIKNEIYSSVDENECT
jgi:hypothetical protein